MAHLPKDKKKTPIFAILFFIALVVGALFLWFSRSGDEDNILSNTNKPPASTQTQAPQTPSQTPAVKTPIPDEFELDVAFTAQAPTGNWDELHNEACEEASVIMTWAYFNDTTSLPPQLVEREITKLTEFQQTNYGYYLSITTPETARMAEEVYGLETEIEAYDEETIKRALMENKLVIVPAQGQYLGNPNFTAPGPLYHMLVVIGWDEQGFITNDPGTRNGANYNYSYDTLESATGNYSHATKLVDIGDKEIIIVSK